MSKDGVWHIFTILSRVKCWKALLHWWWSLLVSVERKAAHKRQTKRSISTSWRKHCQKLGIHFKRNKTEPIQSRAKNDLRKTQTKRIKEVKKGDKSDQGLLRTGLARPPPRRRWSIIILRNSFSKRRVCILREINMNYTRIRNKNKFVTILLSCP